MRGKNGGGVGVAVGGGGVGVVVGGGDVGVAVDIGGWALSWKWNL